ncbi:MAG TPA: GDSL-type esterase/lipase family protein [Saprospiraceae bacterium]|nr:GDSL-type esterase/lipase family protein [Saprospiraceae bacterium]
MKKFKIFICLFIILSSCQTKKTLHFQSDIDNFIVATNTSAQKSDIILFTGSSSFTFWKGVQQDLGCKKIVNWGFGGSTLDDLWNHRKVLFTTYQPKQIFIYCGENDVAKQDNTSTADITNRWQKLHAYIQKKNKNVPIYFISLKPSPSRWHLRTQMQEVNQMVKSYIAQQNQTYFIDVWPAMLNSDGRPKSEIFTKDSLHMNNNGYDIWVDHLMPKVECK